MFQIGFWELIVVLIVTLWVMGPERLPAVARVAGRLLARLKQTYLGIRHELQTEFHRDKNG